MGLTITVGVLTESSSAVYSSQEEAANRGEDFRRVEAAVAGAWGCDYREPYLPWGTRPWGTHLTTASCAQALERIYSSIEEGGLGLHYEECELVNALLILGAERARLDRPRHDCTPLGYCVPFDTREWVVGFGDYDDGIIASAHQLHKECLRIESLIGPKDTIEAEVCRTLREAAHHSLDLGCAIVFTG